MVIMDFGYYNKYENVQTGVDMFDNIVSVGQKVLYKRAAPGGIGLGVIKEIKLTDKTTDDHKLVDSIGFRYGYSCPKSVNARYYYGIETEGKRITFKRATEVIGEFNSVIAEKHYNKIYD